MSNYKVLPIREIVKSYDVLLIDIWGVMYDGLNQYEGAVECLNNMLESGKKIIFLSNNPRPSSLAKARFERWGIDMNKASIYTSGDAVREQLITWNDDVFSKLGRKFYHLGAEVNHDILSGIDADVTDDIKEADFLLITAYIDEGQDLKTHDAALKEAAQLKLPAICANPDLVVHEGATIRYCAGTFSKRYEEMGGIVHYYGKPDIRVFNAVFDRYLKGVDKQKILMIGDTLDTDILGASRAGIDSALVLTGNGEKIAAMLEAGESNIFTKQQAKPTWIAFGMREV